MKRKNIKIAALLTTVMCLNVLPNAYGAENIIKNGDFTEGNASKNPHTANDWGTSSWWQWTWDNTVGYDDNTSIHFNETKTQYQWLYQKVDVAPDTEYMLTFYYKSDDPGVAVLATGIKADGSNGGTLLGEQWIRDTASNWIKKTYTIKSGEYSKMEIRIKIMGSAGGGSTTANGYIDNISLVARKPVVESVTLSGFSAIGKTVTVTDKVTDSFGDKVIESGYQWQISEDGTDWTDIDGETGDELLIPDEYEGMYIRVGVTPKTSGSDGKVREGSVVYSKALKAVNASEFIVYDIKNSFNGLFIADADEALNYGDSEGTLSGYLLKKEDILSDIGESNALECNGVPYVFETESSKRAIASVDGEEFSIDLNNEYLSKINIAMTYDEMPDTEQKAVITYSDDSTSEIIFNPGEICEKTEGVTALNNSGFGMYICGEEGEVAEKGYLYSYEFATDKIQQVKSISFPDCSDNLTVFAVTGEIVDKDALKSLIETDISSIPENIKPSDFETLDGVEAMIRTYELLGGSAEDISGYSEEIFAALRVAAVLNAYNDDEVNAVSDDEGKFVYEELLNLSDIDKEGVTLYSLFNSQLSVEGRKAVQKSLTGKEFKTSEELKKQLMTQIILKGIEYPDAGGVEYISEILTDENIDAVGLLAEDYKNATNKSGFNSKIARKSFDSLEKLAVELKEEKKPTNNKTGGGGGGGMISFPSGNAGITDKKEENNSTAEVNGNITSTPELIMFDDVSKEHWAYKAIYRMKELEIVSGRTEKTFAPDEKVTREEFLKMLTVAFKLKNENDKNNSFSDVLPGAWYEEYINIAISNNIANGISADRFGTGLNITRQDLCTMAVRAGNISIDDDARLAFEDADEVADYAKGAVSYLVNAGVVNGFEDNTFKPNAECTRAQAAKIIYELLNAWRDE